MEEGKGKESKPINAMHRGNLTYNYMLDEVA